MSLIARPVRREIAARLAAVEETHAVRILMAVESGSRAWGFPSPDSDYDVRFVYVRPRDWYLALRPGRDVIEEPISDEIDLGGWDIRKALALLLKSNATINEWLVSPIRYRRDEAFVRAMTALADMAFDPRGLARHYAGIATVALKRCGEDDRVCAKDYLYALRPALAIRALRRAPSSRPPMNMEALLLQADTPRELVAEISALVVAKKSGGERSLMRRSRGVDELVKAALDEAAGVAASPGADDASSAAQLLFLDLVNHDRH